MLVYMSCCEFREFGYILTYTRVSLQSCCPVFTQGIRAWRSVGDEKAMVFGRFRDLYREFDFVVIGDNGQGDLWAAQEMLAYHNMPGPSPTAISRTDALLRAPAGNVWGGRGGLRWAATN